MLFWHKYEQCCNRPVQRHWLPGQLQSCTPAPLPVQPVERTTNCCNIAIEEMLSSVTTAFIGFLWEQDVYQACTILYSAYMSSFNSRLLVVHKICFTKKQTFKIQFSTLKFLRVTKIYDNLIFGRNYLLKSIKASITYKKWWWLTKLNVIYMVFHKKDPFFFLS